MMRLTCSNTCWSSVRVCYDMFAQHLEDFTLQFTVLQMKQRHDVAEATQAQMWITQTHTYRTPYSFYSPLIHDRTSQQPLEDTSKEYGTFSTIPSFLFVLQELLAQNKVRSCWGVWEVFLCAVFLTGDVQVNESIKEQVHLKISERKHSHTNRPVRSKGPRCTNGFRRWRCSAEVDAG